MNHGVTGDVIDLLLAVAAQENWIYGCLNLPGRWNSNTRWLANDHLNNRIDDPHDWRACYRVAAAELTAVSTTF